MTASPLPSCRMRGTEVSNDRWFCRSPHLVVPGRVVDGGYCRQACRVADVGPVSGYLGDVSYPVPMPEAASIEVARETSRIAIGVVTAPRAIPTLGNTLLELRRAGFHGEIRIFAEPSSIVPNHPGIRTDWNSTTLGGWGNWLRAARTLLDETDSEFLLLCEDDLWLTRDASLALSHAIETLPHSDWGYASLYSPVHNAATAIPVLGWQSWSHPEADWGALAYCFTRQSLRKVVERRQGSPPPSRSDTDTLVTATLRALGLKRHFHVPSLCAHAGGMNSASRHCWHPDHRAYGFDHSRTTYHEPPRPRGDRRLRVAILTPGLGMGGAEHWIRNLVRSLDEDRIRVTAVGVMGSGPAHEDIVTDILEQTTILTHCDNADGTLLQRAGVIRTASGWDTLQRLADGSDVCISWGTPHLDDWFTALNYSGRVVSVSQGACDWTRFILLTSSGRNHERVGVSRAAAAVFPAGPRRVIYNGSDERRCLQTIPRDEVRRRWKIAPNEVVVGYLGRFSPEKNPVAAALASGRLGAPYRAVYVGNDPTAEPLRTDALALDPLAVFDGPRHDVGNVLRGFDVFVLASPSEGLSLAMNEAWICGVPVIATPVGGVPELEEQFGQMVVRVPVNPSADDLADAVRTATDPRFSPIVRNARDVALKHLTASALGRNWTEYLLQGG